VEGIVGEERRRAAGLVGGVNAVLRALQENAHMILEKIQ
jgi:hypothetical protein